MSTARRSLLLAATTATAVMTTLGLTPAHASFSDSVGGGTTIATGSVAAPTNVVGSLACSSPNSTMGLTWTASTSTRVSGYLVTVYFSDGFKQTVQAAATASGWSSSISTFNVTKYSVQYSVTTQTQYGWTQESTRTGWFHC